MARLVRRQGTAEEGGMRIAEVARDGHRDMAENVGARREGAAFFVSLAP